MKAVIDLGTNTFNLLVAAVDDHGFKEIFSKELPVKIGSGGINQGYITPEAFERGLRALQYFSEIISKYPVQSIVATGTSAIRNASNGHEFLQLVKEKFGFTISKISGETEAMCIFKGASMAFDFPDENILVMDIGGGSVEFILGRQNQILWKQSFEIGAARLLALYGSCNPIQTHIQDDMQQYLLKQLIPLWQYIDNLDQKPHKLIGTAGTFETLVEVLESDLKQPLKALSLNAKEVTKAQLSQYFDVMVPSNETQRLSLKGLVDFRVEMIVPASILLKVVWEKLRFDSLVCSNYALKEGLLYYPI